MNSSKDGYISFSSGSWIACYLKDRIWYSESRYGDNAKELAEAALCKLKSGTFDPREDMLLKHSWTNKDASAYLGITTGQLVRWQQTGRILDQEIRPPRKDPKGTDRIVGFELVTARERLDAHRNKKGA